MSSDVRRVHALPEIVKQRLTICDKSTGYKMANTLAGSFFMQGTMDKYSNTRKFKNMHVIKTQYVLLLIKIAYMEKKC